MLFFLMIRRPPRSTRTDTLFPYTTLFRSSLFYIIYIMRSKPSRHGYLGKTPRIRAVTAFRFREMRLSCALSVAAAAKVLHVTARTLHNWESGASRVPYAAYKLLRLLRGGELPGAAWKGWRLHGEIGRAPV